MKKINVLIIGSGCREHAIAWKIAQSPRLQKLFITPGNSGTATVGENVILDLSTNQAVVEFAKKNAIGLVVVTPDDYLAAGMVDALQDAGIMAFGPTKNAAQIESSKKFSKDLMKQAGVPTATFKTFTDFDSAKSYVTSHQYPLVIKASGLALGKGVVVANNRSDAEKTLSDIMVHKVFGNAGSTVIIEEFLHGTEISVHAFCDGQTAVLFPSSQDHKQINDGDRGPNTGGMGTVVPLSWVTPVLMEEIRKKVVEPILQELNKCGTPFTGLLYPGLMITKEGPKVLEFNARFGDPEAESYMRVLDSDLLPILVACCTGTLCQTQVTWKPGAACCIIIASKGYPASSEKGVPVTGLEKAGTLKDVVVFHGGLTRRGRETLTNGGRVLGVTATGKDLPDALKKAYAGVQVIAFPGMQFRRDIGKRRPPTHTI